ncbi:YhcN/YlaJ family sporulation lipoprotein [Desulfotomaculum sp. 1211_IL3151]|uniref:YhcN/YlaJ family sporulation lipoprotein n=1 Tax=Desulfotomaculum sp. 1211_IL3151 TaxID=3084055 RepID=UPI002FDAF4C2
MKKVFTFVLLGMMILSLGCQMQSTKKPEQKSAKKEKSVQIEPELAEKAKKAALTVKGVEASTAVVIDKNISTGIKVSGFDRLRLDSIKKEVHSKMSEINDEYQIHVTSDKKLFKELQEIEKKITEKNLRTTTELHKKVEGINKDMNG